VGHFRSSIGEVRGGGVEFKFFTVDRLLRVDKLPEDVAERLRAVDGRFVVWGAKPRGLRGVSKKCREDMRRGTVAFLLFYVPAGLCIVGRIVAATESERIAEELWGRDADGATWSFVYFVEPVGVLRADIDEVRRLVNHPIPGHTCICRDSNPQGFEALRQYISSREGSNVKRFTRSHLVSWSKLGDKFLDIFGSVVTSLVDPSRGPITKDACLSAAANTVRNVMSGASDVEKTYGVPICNDLRRLCLITLGRDGDWGSNDIARVAPVGEIIRGIYEVLSSEGVAETNDLVRLLSALSVVVFEYRGELGISCPADSLEGKLSDVHRDLFETAVGVLRNLLVNRPDLVAVIPVKVWSLALKRSEK